jgi:PAS domain S-box-containing protein
VTIANNSVTHPSETHGSRPPGASAPGAGLWVRQLAPYLIAVVSVAIAVAITSGIPSLKEKTSQILLVGAVVVSSYAGGLGPGLLAVFLSAAGWAAFVVPPGGSIAVETPSEVLRLVLFVGVAVLISSLHEQSKRAKACLLQQERRLALALEAAQMAVWDYDLKQDVFWTSPELRQIFGVGADDEFSPTYGGFIAFVHPDDRAPVVRAMTTSRENRIEFQIEHRIVRRDKSVRWIATRGRTFVDSQGRAERMIGVVVDVTDDHDPARLHKAIAGAEANPAGAGAAAAATRENTVV